MWKIPYKKANASTLEVVDEENGDEKSEEESMLDTAMLAEDNGGHFKVGNGWISSCILSTMKFLSPTFSKNEIIDFISKKDIQRCVKETYLGLKTASEEHNFLKIENEQGTFQQMWPNTTNRSRHKLMTEDILDFIDAINEKKKDPEYFWSLLVLKNGASDCTISNFCNVKNLLKASNLGSAVKENTKMVRKTNEVLEGAIKKIEKLEGEKQKFEDEISTMTEKLMNEIKRMNNEHEKTVKSLTQKIEKYENTAVKKISAAPAQTDRSKTPKNSNNQEKATQKENMTSAEKPEDSEKKTNENNWHVPDYLKQKLLKKPVTGRSKTVEPKLNNERKHAHYPLVFSSDTYDLKEEDIKEASKDWPFYVSREGKVENELEIIQMEDSHIKKFYVNCHCYENPKMNPKWHPKNCRVETYTGLNKPKKFTDKKAILHLGIYNLHEFVGKEVFVKNTAEKLEIDNKEILNELGKIYTNIDEEETRISFVTEKRENNRWWIKPTYVKLVAKSHQFEETSLGCALRWGFWTGFPPKLNKKSGNNENKMKTQRTYGISEAQHITRLKNKTRTLQSFKNSNKYSVLSSSS